MVANARHTPLAWVALRHRKQDIALLVQHFLKLKPFQLSPETLAALQSYDWPGNVRELENVIERACIVYNGDTLIPQHLPSNMFTIADDEFKVNASLHLLNVSSGALSIPDAVAQIEKQLILAALEETQGNKSKAAKRLEINERSLWYKLDQYELR